MPDVPQDTARMIADKAREVQILKSTMERAKTFEERVQCQQLLERAEQQMVDLAMTVNRGLSRNEPQANQ